MSLIGVRTPALGGAARSLRGRGRGRHRISAQHGRLRHHRRRRHLYAHGRACASRAGTQAFEPSSALAVGAMRDGRPRLRPRARTRGRSYLRRRDALAGRRLVVHDPRSGRGLLYSAHVQPLGVRAHAKSARDSSSALAVGAMRDAPPRLRPRARTRGRSYLRRRDALAGRRLVVHDPRSGRGLLYSAHVQPLGVRAHAKSARGSGGARGERGRRSERTHQRPEDVVEGDAQLLLLQPRLAARP